MSDDFVRVAETEMQVVVPECKADAKSRLTYSFSVRAVNMGPDNTSLAAGWSEPGETSCYNAGQNTLHTTHYTSNGSKLL